MQPGTKLHIQGQEMKDNSTELIEVGGSTSLTQINFTKI